MDGRRMNAAQSELTRCQESAYVVDTGVRVRELMAGSYGVPTVSVARSRAAPSIDPSVRTLPRHSAIVVRAFRSALRPGGRWLRVVAACVSVAVPCAVQAQRDACDPAELEVRSVVFSGNRAFTNSQLAGVIAITAS
jgi:hypothetical protein